MSRLNGPLADEQGGKRRLGRADKWLFWPTLLTMLVGLIDTLLCGLPGIVSFLLIPISLIGFFSVALGLVVLAVALAIRRRFRNAGSVVLALLVPVVMWAPISWTADCLHLGLMLGVEKFSGVDAPRKRTNFAVYDWSVGLAGGSNTFLIYDASDEIALPPDEHTRPLSTENGFAEDCAGKVRHLLGHYYVCDD